MIEIVNAYTRSGNEWCTCCQKQTNAKRIKFSYDGRQGNSVVLCDDCRRELAQVIGAIPIPEGATNGDMIKAIFDIPDSEIDEGLSTTYIYTSKRVLKGGSQDYLRKQITFCRDWWNAPYKAESEDKE